MRMRLSRRCITRLRERRASSFNTTSVAPRNGRSRRLRHGVKLDIVQGRALLTSGDPFDANFVSGVKLQMLDATARCGIAADFYGREMGIGNPFVHQLRADVHAVCGFAIIGVKVLDIQIVESGIFGKAERGSTALRLRAFYCFASRGVLPRSYVYWRVALELHSFGLDTVWMIPYAPFRVRNAGGAEEPIANGVAPDDGVPGLIFEAR